MNSNTNKFLKSLQEQYDQYLIDLDPTTTDAKIGHTTNPFPDENEITSTSGELVSQKSFIPDEAKQYSKIKNNDNLLGNKQIDDEEKKYTNPSYNSNPNKEMLNIGEGKINQLNDDDEMSTSDEISKTLKEIKSAINNLYSINKLLTRLSVETHHEYSPKELENVLAHVISVENRMIDDLENHFDMNIQQVVKSELDEEFKSKAQAKYFYAQANKPGKTGKKWKRMADEFSSKTPNYKKLPAHIKESTNNNLNNLLDRLLK